MTRRRFRNDKVEQRVAAKVDDIKFRSNIAEVIETEWVREDGGVMTPEYLSVLMERMAYSPLASRQAREILSVIADDMGISPRQAPVIEDLVHRLARIQIESDLDKVVADGDEDLLWCDSHGWAEQLGFPACAACPCEIPEKSLAGSDRIGRPRRYCSDACRQRAYRRRVRGPRDSDLDIVRLRT